MRERAVAEYTRREVVTRRVEFALPNPSNATEYAKACAAARQELEAAGREIYDNTITISATDAEIVLSYEEQHAVKGAEGKDADALRVLLEEALDLWSIADAISNVGPGVYDPDSEISRIRREAGL